MTFDDDEDEDMEGMLTSDRRSSKMTEEFQTHEI